MMVRSLAAPRDVRAMITRELSYGNLTSGEYVGDLEDKMSLQVGAGVVAVSSGTMALKIALVAAGIGAGSRVLVPDVTFAACASVVLELGATPVYAEVDPVTFLMDESSARGALNIDLIMFVRLAGEPTPAWVYDVGPQVIIDSAHSMDGHDARAFATCYSFHPTKIVSGIEGGAIALNTPEMIVLAKKMRLFGFAEGTRTPSWPGFKGNMTNISACLTLFNLGRMQASLTSRQWVRDTYNSRLGLSKQGLGYYMVTVDDPDALCMVIPAIRHYPQTLSKVYAGVDANPIAAWVADHLVSIPFHEQLVDNDLILVCDTVKQRLITH